MIQIKIGNEGEIRGMLIKMRERGQNLSPVMRVIAGIMRAEVKENFEAEGRPKWKQSARAKKEGGKTLQRSGRLAKSITSRSDSDSAIVGTNVVYAAAHQFGVDRNVSVKPFSRKNDRRSVFSTGKRAGSEYGRRTQIMQGISSVKGHTRHMSLPARPFLKISDDGIDSIKQAILRHLTSG